MKHNYVIYFCLALLLTTPFKAQARSFDQTTRTIEILRREIDVLSLLIKNFQLAQTPDRLISADSYVAINLSDNQVLSQKNVEKPQSIASITKLMNAVIATENIPAGQTITLTPPMLSPEGQSPSLYSGLTITKENLLKASLTQSVNDAAEVLSYFLDPQLFLTKMNQKAQDLHMADTKFVDAHGLSTENTSTAQDLAKLVAYIYQHHPKILRTTKDNDFWLPDANGRALKFYNENSFYYLPQFIGGKTGYLPKARQSLTSVFNVNGQSVAIIILNSANRQADTFAILNTLSR